MSKDSSKPDPRNAPTGEAPLCTVRGEYRPAPPEVQSRVSRLVVRAEITLMVLVVAAIGWRFERAHRQDKTPAKVASFHARGLNLSSLPPGFDAAAANASSSDGADPAKGQVLYMQTCTACHGQNLQGMPHQGVSLLENKFIASTNDHKLVAFLKLGRKPADNKNTTGLLMPPRGGNPSLDDDALANIVAFLRQSQKETTTAAQETTNAPTQQQTRASESPTTRPIADIDTRPIGSTAD